MRGRRRLLAMGLIAAVFLVGWQQRGLARRRADSASFETVARRAMKAVARGNWTAFAREAAGDIVIGQYVRAYPATITEERRQEFWPGPLFSRKEMDEGEGRVGVYATALLRVSTRKPLKTPDRRAFMSFCSIVGKSWTTERGVNTVSLHNTGAEISELRGPAVSGTYASNVHWRIELSRDTGEWKVTRLILEEH